MPAIGSEIALFVVLITISALTGYHRHLRATSKKWIPPMLLVTGFVLLLFSLAHSGCLVIVSSAVAAFGIVRGVHLILLAKKTALSPPATEEATVPGVNHWAQPGGILLIVLMATLAASAIYFSLQ